MEQCWAQAVEMVVYELARHNGESPLDRGAALRRHVAELAGELGWVRAFDRLAAERGWYREESGEESAARVRELVIGAVAADTLLAA